MSLVDSKPKPSPFTNSAAADIAFRGALARGDYPTVPPALAAAVDAGQRLETLNRAPREVATMADVVRRAVDDLLAGRPVDPAEFDAAVLRTHQETILQSARMQIDSTMHRQLEAGWRSVVAESLPDLLDGLRDELDDVLARARAARTALDGLAIDDTSAIASASNAQRKALVDLAPLAARYERLRHAQQAAYAVATDRFPGHRGLEALPGDPTWQDVFDRGTFEFSDVPLLGTLPAHPAGIARLLRVAKRQDVWLPTREQLDEAHAELSLDLADLRARRAGRVAVPA